MDIVIAGLFALAFILLANILYLRDRKIEQLIFDLFLSFFSVVVLLLGVAALFLPPDQFAQLFPGGDGSLLDARSFGIVLSVTAAVALLIGFRRVRQLLSVFLPIKPASPVHTLALVLSVYLLGYNALILSQGGLTGLAETAEPAPLYFQVIADLLFIAVAVFGVGFPFRRRGQELIDRLGLQRITLRELLLAVGLVIILVLLQACVGLILFSIDPDQSEVLSEINTNLFAEINTVWEWLVLALATGIAEELLFRGAIQPALGLGFTSIIFAFIHIQYGYTAVTVFVILLAILLGFLRRYFSTTMTILVHAGYNFTLGLLALLAAYLEQFVT